jgi:AAA family ATP:ADP antiporter
MAFPLKSLLSRWKTQFWPIETFELKKFLPLFFIKFFITLIYSVLTIMKDASVVTAKGGSAEVIPILKGWIVLPAAMGAAVLYSKLSNTFKRSALFYGIIGFFMAFMFLYGFVLYPNLEALSPHESADRLTAWVGQENSHWVAIYRNWIQSIFFVMAELWGQIVIFLLFWGFVNHICNFGEAKRCYNIFLAGGDLALIFTGPLVLFLTRGTDLTGFGPALQNLVLCILGFGIGIVSLHWLLTHFMKKDPRLFQPEEKGAALDTKTKLSLWESLRFIARSKYLLCIAMMVVAYGLTINLTEVTWKANVKIAYPETADYQAFMAGLSSFIGFGSLFVSLFFSGLIVRRLGWHFSAQLTPIVVGTTSLVFLSLYLFREWIGPYQNMAPLLAVVLFGAFQNGLSKLMKYTFFDSTKEMSYIPLDQESKTKGKAAIDVIGSRLGKSGAAWIQIVLIQIAGTGSVLSITHFLLPLIGATVIFWILSVRSLNKQLAAVQSP